MVEPTSISPQWSSTPVASARRGGGSLCARAAAARERGLQLRHARDARVPEHAERGPVQLVDQLQRARREELTEEEELDEIMAAAEKLL